MTADSMLSFDQAQLIVEKLRLPLEDEWVDLDRLHGRIISQAPIASTDLPPFTTSSVDGYGLGPSTAKILRVVGSLQAGRQGKEFQYSLDSCVRVFTGSSLPSWVEAVVMQEDVSRSGDQIALKENLSPGTNMRFVGEELTRGQELVPVGLKVSPPAVALMASGGCVGVRVLRKPIIAIVELGSELISGGRVLGPGQIFAANGIALAAAVDLLGCEARMYRVPDDRNSIRDLLSDLGENSDCILTSGGISVGDFDFVRGIWSELGAKELFWRTAIKPGKPLFCAELINGHITFGLPGNPVSTLVTFFLFVRPLLLRSLRQSVQKPIKVVTGERFERHALFDVFARAVITGAGVRLVEGPGSHMSSGLVEASGLVRIRPGERPLPLGSHVDYWSLNWQ